MAIDGCAIAVPYIHVEVRLSRVRPYSVASFEIKRARLLLVTRQLGDQSPQWPDKRIIVSWRVMSLSSLRILSALMVFEEIFGSEIDG